MLPISIDFLFIQKKREDLINAICEKRLSIFEKDGVLDLGQIECLYHLIFDEYLNLNENEYYRIKRAYKLPEDYRPYSKFI